MVYMPNITVTGSLFRMGSALYGGAFYSSGLPAGTNMTVLFKDCDFISNEAGKSGASIYFDEMDLYNMMVDDVRFTKNQGRRYGDNLFVR